MSLELTPNELARATYHANYNNALYLNLDEELLKSHSEVTTAHIGVMVQDVALELSGYQFPENKVIGFIAFASQLKPSELRAACKFLNEFVTNKVGDFA